MSDPKSVVTKEGGATAEKAAAWERVSRMFAISFALVGGAALYQDGGYSAGLALAGAAAIGLLTYIVFGAIGAARGLGGISAFHDKTNRVKIATGFGVFCALLGGSGVYFHDGAPLATALLSGAGLGLVGFLAAYFPIIPVIASILSIFG